MRIVTSQKTMAVSRKGGRLPPTDSAVEVDRYYDADAGMFVAVPLPTANILVRSGQALAWPTEKGFDHEAFLAKARGTGKTADDAVVDLATQLKTIMAKDEAAAVDAAAETKGT